MVKRGGARRRVILGVVSAVLFGAATPALADDTVDVCANAAEESQALRRDGKLSAARERLVVCAGPTCPGFIQKDCAAWLADVEKNLPSVVVRATDGKGKDLTQVKVTVDGKVLTTRLDGRPLAVDPGEHVFTYDAVGWASVADTVLVRQGETNRLVSMTFTAPSGGPAARSEASSTAGDAKPAAGVPTVSWVVGGAGVVLVGLSAVLWGVGRGDHASMESGCARTRSCLQSDVDSAQTKLLVGDIAFGVGLVALGAAVVYALVSKPARSAAMSWRSPSVIGGSTFPDRGYAVQMP